MFDCKAFIQDNVKSRYSNATELDEPLMNSFILLQSQNKNHKSEIAH